MGRLLLLIAFTLTPAFAAQTSTPLSLSVSRACMVVGPGLPAAQLAAGRPALTIKCNRGSAAPSTPLEVVAAPIADWQLTAHTQSADGAELFTYAAQAPASVGSASGVSLDFY